MSSTQQAPDHSRVLSSREIFLRACRCKEVPRVPVWIMRQAGRYLPEYRALRAKHSFLEVCKTPDLAAEVSLQPLRRLSVDAVIVFSDILIVAEAMGLKLELGDSGPNLPEPVRSPAEVHRLREFDPEQQTAFLPEAIRRLCRALGSDVPVLGFAAAPWTLACYMIEGRAQEGFPNAKAFLHDEPRGFRALLDKIAGATVPYLKAQIAAGASAVQLFDTWCGELSLADYQEHVLPATREVVSALKSAGVPVILYTKASHHLLPAVVRTGADVLSVDWRVSMSELRRLAGPSVAIQGNVDPAALCASPRRVQKAVSDALAELHGRGHILNLGHGILPQTPVENAVLFVHAGQAARHEQFVSPK
ncbi:MAG TPA: uroporphyrinogen decarboxylase [Methylomirabilota bacterium]|nr:uroporphyrinogen decarboxylase [Methylomirabilota bacterium]